jgi:hypothetical protein
VNYGKESNTTLSLCHEPVDGSSSTTLGGDGRFIDFPGKSFSADYTDYAEDVDTTEISISDIRCRLPMALGFPGLCYLRNLWISIPSNADEPSRAVELS